jgi:hypothetical protein
MGKQIERRQFILMMLFPYAPTLCHAKGLEFEVVSQFEK